MAAPLSSELQFLLDEKEVPKEYQEKLRAMGITNLGKFALLDDTRAAIRTLLKGEMGFTTDVDPNARAHHCAFIEAWECAEARSKADREAAATARSTNVPRQLPAGDLLGLRRAFKDQHFQLDDNEAPSDMLVEMRLDMIEKGEQRAESLAQVTAKKEGVDDHTDVSEVLLNGVVRIKKAPKPIAMPRDTEELRRRLRTWGWSWIHAQAKHSSRPSLAGITPQTIYNYIEHLLGDTVYRLAARNHDGTTVSRPRLYHVLDYDHAVRKHLANLMNDGVDFVSGLKASYESVEVRERFFLTPVMLDAVATRERSRSRDDGRRKKSESKADINKVKGTGKAKWLTKTLDGKMICFAWNRKTGCKTKNCKFQHVCQVCLKPHAGGATCCRGNIGSKSDTKAAGGSSAER